MNGTRLRVGLDVSSAVDARPTGVARYILSLVRHLAQLSEAPSLTLYCRASRRRNGAPQRLFDRPVLSMPLVASGVDVLHSPDVRLPRWLRVPAVVTIHDLSAYERDDHASPKFLRRKRAAIERAVQRAAFIVTHSETVRRSILERFRRSDDSVVAVPIASGLPRTVGDAATPPGDVRRLLVVGGPSIRKGERRVAPLLRFLDEELDWRPGIDWVGSADPAAAERLLASLPSVQRARIRFLGHVDDHRLDRLYREVEGYLQLSDTEGFAMPLIEAAERHCPILSIDAPILRETIGASGAVFFDDDLPRSRAAFERFRSLNGRLEVRARALQQASEYSWTRAAAATYQLLARCTERR